MARDLLALLYRPFADVSVLNFVLCALSFSWLLWRATKIMKIPLDDLVRLLAVEVPPSPNVGILSISSDSVSLRLETMERTTKYEVYANGSFLGHLQHGEPAFTVSNLAPGQRYLFRVKASNTSDYTAASEPIRILTEPETTGQASKDVKDTKPTLSPCKAFPELTSVSTATPIIHREHSGSFSRRTNSIRRASPATFLDTPGIATEQPRAESVLDGVFELQSKLEQLRRDTEEAQKQEEEEEMDFQGTQQELMEKRENIKQQLKKKEDESSDLTKVVRNLEQKFTASQSKKSRTEKERNRLRAERDKDIQDAERWERDIPSLIEDTKSYQQRKIKNAEETQERIKAIREEGEVEQAAMKQIEEQIREAGIEVRRLEEEKVSLEEAADEGGSHERQRKAQQEEFEWRQKLNDLEVRVTRAFQEMQTARQHCEYAQQQAEQMQYWRARQDSQMQAYDTANLHAESNMTRTDSQGGYQASPAQASNGLPDSRLRHSSLQARNLLNHSPAVPAPTPFFNTADMLQVPSRSPAEEGMSDAEAEQLTAAALASPSAGALLPNDLLEDELEDPTENVALTPLPAAAELADSQASAAPESPSSFYLPGLGAEPPDSFGGRADLASPMSTDDAPLSLTSSAKNSISNFHQHRASNSGVDTDRRSVRSVSSTSRDVRRTAFPLGSRALFGRARASSSGEDGFAFGALPNSQSRSLPRADEESGEPSSGNLGVFKKRGASSSGGLFNTLWGKKSIDDGGTWPRSSASRPNSMYSTDNTSSVLPVPGSSEAAFGWGGAQGPGHTSRVGSVAYPWSTIPSRRTSVNHEAPASMPSNLHDLEMDSSEIRDDDTPSVQAPIGTRPSKPKVESPAARLNPAARDFKSLFDIGSDKKADKAKKKNKTAISDDAENDGTGYITPDRNKENRLSLLPESGEVTADDMDSSPAKSADTPSSTKDKGDSMFRKMTRKGSSSRFSLPGSLFSRRNTSTQPSTSTDDIVQEEDLPRADSGASASTKETNGGITRDRDSKDATSIGMGRSLESVASGSGSTKSGGFSIPGFGRKRAKKDKDKDKDKEDQAANKSAPSISEVSMASTETGDETDEGRVFDRESEEEVGSLSLVGRMSREDGW